jgi:hypothetical protein
MHPVATCHCHTNSTRCHSESGWLSCRCSHIALFTEVVLLAEQLNGTDFNGWVLAGGQGDNCAFKSCQQQENLVAMQSPVGLGCCYVVADSNSGAGAAFADMLPAGQLSAHQQCPEQELSFCYTWQGWHR